MFSILYQYETMLSSIVRGVCHQFCVLEKKEKGETNLYCLSHPSVTFSLVAKKPVLPNSKLKRTGSGLQFVGQMLKRAKIGYL